MQFLAGSSALRAGALAAIISPRPVVGLRVLFKVIVGQVFEVVDLLPGSILRLSLCLLLLR